MTKKLHISSKLSLPLDAVTSTIVVYGGKGMGKTNLASVLVEEFAACGLRFAVIDPMGVWWGLRHSTDGKGVGIEVLILGGIHGDLPIEPTSGAIVADLVVDEDASVIIDISRRPDGSMWSISERIRFVTAFAKRAYQRQGEKRRPLNLVIDEAARFAPQIVRQGESEVAACMGAVAVIVEEGRNVGIGVTLVTQRSARLNKDVAELADCMIAFRIVGPNSMRAVLDWLGEHVEKRRLNEIGQQLRELPRGSALVVSPGWLEFEGVVPMRARETFDSSATPKPGQQVKASGPGAKLDLAKYRERLTEVVERAKADDPKMLRAKIAELVKERDQLSRAASAKIEIKIVEKAVFKDAELKRVEKILTGMQGLADRVEKINAGAIEKIEAINGTLDDQFDGVVDILKEISHRVGAQAMTPIVKTNGVRPIDPLINGTAKALREREPQREPKIVDNSKPLPSGEATVLRAAIQFADGLFKKQLTTLTGYKLSTRNAYIARLRDRGYLTEDGNRIQVTAEGIAAMPDAEPLPVGEALRDYWIARLPSGERAVFELLVNAYSMAVEKPDIDEKTSFKVSTRNAYLARLAAKELVVDAGSATVKANDSLFEN